MFHAGTLETRLNVKMLNDSVTSEVQGVTCHMRSNSVTYHPTCKWIKSRLSPVRQAGTRLIYSVGMAGWVDLNSGVHTEMIYLHLDVHY